MTLWARGASECVVRLLYHCERCCDHHVAGVAMMTIWCCIMLVGFSVQPVIIVCLLPAAHTCVFPRLVAAWHTHAETLQKNSTTGADASGELMRLAEELANCDAMQ